MQQANGTTSVTKSVQTPAGTKTTSVTTTANGSTDKSYSNVGANGKVLERDTVSVAPNGTVNSASTTTPLGTFTLSSNGGKTPTISFAPKGSSTVSAFTFPVSKTTAKVFFFYVNKKASTPLRRSLRAELTQLTTASAKKAAAKPLAVRVKLVKEGKHLALKLVLKKGTKLKPGTYRLSVNLQSKHHHKKITQTFKVI